MSVHQRPPERPQRKADIQIDLVVSSFARAGIGIGVRRFEDGELDFLYQQGFILVRDAYLDRVGAIVGGQPFDGLIDGVTLWALPEPAEEGAPEQAEPERGRIPAVVDAVEAIERELGVGVATPNHVLSITPGAVCPATEPEEARADAGPEPGICAGDHGGGVVVKVIDTGLLGDAAAHPWLTGVTGDPDESVAPDIPPYTGHGTFVAGVARCMAPASEMRVANLLQFAGAQLEGEIIKQVDQALGESPDIISLSAGGTSWKNLPPLGFEALWQRYRHHKGVLLVAAAGNNSERRPFWPAAFPQVLGVGALGANWRSRAWFSNYGGWVDVYAPGEGLVNAYATGTFVCREPPHIGEVRHFQGMARWSGTSFSTPLVSGLVAARMSRTGENSRLAGRALLTMARERAIGGLGPVVYPCEFGDRHHHHGECCDHPHHGCPQYSDHGYHRSHRHQHGYCGCR